jgi:glycogen operon protein
MSETFIRDRLRPIDEDLAGYRFAGPWDEMVGHASRSAIAGIHTRRGWPRRVGAEPTGGYVPHCARPAFDDFVDWQDDRSLEIPINDLVIYELHVRGFTAHARQGIRPNIRRHHCEDSYQKKPPIVLS